MSQLTNGISIGQQLQPMITNLVQYGNCIIAKDAGSKWSNPRKTIRAAEDIIEAIHMLNNRINNGLNINPFTGHPRGTAVQEDKVVAETTQGKVYQKPEKPKYDPKVAKLEKEMFALKKSNQQMFTLIKGLGDKLDAINPPPPPK